MVLAATTRDRVKEWLGESDNDELNAQLDQLLAPVSQAIEGPSLLNRKLLAEERTEDIPRIRDWQRTLSLRQAPVDAAAAFTINYDPAADWTTALTVDSTSYVVVHDQGVVHTVSRVPWRYLVGYDYIRITYTAGLAADFDALKAAYPDVVQAATLWVAEIWRRREGLTQTGESLPGKGGQLSFSKALAHPPEAVRGLLLPYRRLPIRG